VSAPASAVARGRFVRAGAPRRPPPTVTLAGAAGLALGVWACASRPAPRPVSGARGRTASGDVTARHARADRLLGVVLTTGPAPGRLSATGPWTLTTRDGRPVVRGTGRGVWTLSRRGGRLRLASRDGLAATREGPLIATPASADALLSWNGHRYRGALELSIGPAGLTAVNRVPVEDYLRGVVPLEIGAVGEAARAAVEAQAVAARSYAYVRLDDPDRPAGGRRYDMLSTVTDQVYGGADAETALADEAVAATAGVVVMYAGRVVNAPYHAACGGSTAEPPEVWREAAIPYLQRVSDQIPGTDRYYCEGSADFRWTRTFTRSELDATLDRYLRRYAAPADQGPDARAGDARGGDPRPVGAIRSVAIDSYTPSGRVAWLVVTTSRGTFRVRGNDIRSVLRSSRGTILNSTYFSIEDEPVRSGRVASLTLRGRGNGHGVGMCQWGAIGRARAGQDYRTILQTYYPGTTLALEQ